MADKKKSASGVDNTVRRHWDRDEFAAKAAEREEAAEAAASAKPVPNCPLARGEIVVREALRQRDYKVDLTSRLGKTQVVTTQTPLSQQAGYYCNVCECIVKDSANFLDHINGKKHQRALGMSMRVERVGLEAVRQRFETNKRKMEAKEKGEDDYERRLMRLQDEEESRKRERKERKRQKKLEAEKERSALDEGVDPDMAAMMGFGGFGGK